MVSFPTVSELKPRTRTVVMLAVLAALPLVFLAPLFQAPFDSDQGVYATVARGWLHGAIPYRDLWDNKGPLLYLWYVASFWSIGDSLIAPRVTAGIVAGLCVPFVWAAGSALFGRREGAVAAGLFALSFSNVYLQVTANAEVFMLLPFIVGFWSFAMGARSRGAWWFLAAGALTSLAVFTRQSALWAFVAYASWLGVLFVRRPQERPQLARAGVLLVLGGLLGAVPFVAYFAAHGALHELWYAMFVFNWLWAGEFPFYRKIVPPILVNPVPLLGGLAFWMLAAVGVWRLWKRNDRFAWLVLSFLLCSEAAAQTLGKASPHYSIHLLPGAALAGGVGLLYVKERWQQSHRAMGVLIMAAAVVTVASAIFAYGQRTSADRFRVQYNFQGYADRAVAASQIAAAVEGMTKPGDYVYEWGRESEIYFLADRRPASRWVHNRAFAVDQSIVAEILADLRKRQPTVILLTQDQIRRGGRQLPSTLAVYLEQHYRYAGSVEYAELYKLQGE